MNRPREKGCVGMNNKLKFLGFMMVLCILANGCRSGEAAPGSSQTPQDGASSSGDPVQLTIDAGQLQPLDIPTDASIFTVQEDYLLYRRMEEAAEAESEAVLLYYYGFETGENQYLGNVVLPDMYANPAVQIGDCLYFLGGLEGRPCGICRLDLDTLETAQICQLDSGTFFPRLNRFGDQLVLLSVTSDQEADRVYRLEVLSPDGGDRTVVAERVFSSDTGAILSCMDTDGEFLYVLEEEKRPEGWAYRILRCTPDGETDSSAVDLSGLLETGANGSGEDTVMQMEKVGDYLMLCTLNGRIYLLGAADGAVKEIDPAFYQFIPGGYSFLTEAAPDADSLYILSQKGGPAIYRFRGETADFQEIQVSMDETLSLLTGYGTQVVVQDRTDTETYDGPFYLGSLSA